MHRDENNEATSSGEKSIAPSDVDKDGCVVEAAGFAAMNNLRLLMINRVNLNGPYESMPKRIKWLQWQRCPLEFLPPDFHLEEAAALDLSYSNITQVQRQQEWQGLKILKRFIERRRVPQTVFERLRFLDLTACNNLTITPDLSAFPGLEKLVLDLCVNLVEIHNSLANLKSLVVLSMSGCQNLEDLPDYILHLSSLEVLNLAHCSHLKTLPDCIGQLPSLKKLDVSYCTRLTKVPTVNNVAKRAGIISNKWIKEVQITYQ